MSTIKVIVAIVAFVVQLGTVLLEVGFTLTLGTLFFQHLVVVDILVIAVGELILHTILRSLAIIEGKR